MVIFDLMVGLPIKGFLKLSQYLAQLADEEMNNPEPVQKELLNLRTLLEMGEIAPEEFAARETQLLRRLREIKERRAALEESGQRSS